MKTLEYNISIAAPVKKVWDTMLQPKTYQEWVNVSWPDSFYQGEWKQGEKIRFIGDNGSGTLAEITELKPHDTVLAEHIAVLNPGGTEDRESEVAKGWIGINERYTFTERNGKTDIKVTIKTNPAWQKMFDDGWPAALKKLKEMCE